MLERLQIIGPPFAWTYEQRVWSDDPSKQRAPFARDLSVLLPLCSGPPVGFAVVHCSPGVPSFIGPLPQNDRLSNNLRDHFDRLDWLHRLNRLDSLNCFDRLNSLNGLQTLEIEALNDAKAALSRADFETPWNRWNRMRTLNSIVVVLVLLLLLYRL